MSTVVSKESWIRMFSMKHVFNVIPCKIAAAVDKLYVRHLIQPQHLTLPTSNVIKAATKFPVHVRILTAGLYR